jgi:uncharacterized protein with ATP-grasp and redox domains
MFIWPDCIPCILKMSLEVARLSMKEEHAVKAFMGEIVRLPPLRGEEWNITSPEIIQWIWERMARITKDEDPLREIKAEQNRRALDLYGAASDRVRKSADPFLAALKLAIAGNSMDAMVNLHHDRWAGDFQGDLTGDWVLTDEGAEGLRNRLQEATRIVYLLDNCGEIVFDRLFLEVLKETYTREVSVVVRSRPILNDATIVEARSVGLPAVAPVIENGIPGPFPGTRLHLVSTDVRRLLMDADLVVAKGGGNLDSLTEDSQLKGRISFLFHGKCHPFCAPRNVSPGTLIVDNQ